MISSMTIPVDGVAAWKVKVITILLKCLGIKPTYNGKEIVINSMIKGNDILKIIGRSGGLQREY